MTKRVFLTAFAILLALCCVFTVACFRSFQELAGLSEMVYAAPL
jgi:hypothetical protein